MLWHPRMLPVLAKGGEGRATDAEEISERRRTRLPLRSDPSVPFTRIRNGL